MKLFSWSIIYTIKQRQILFILYKFENLKILKERIFFNYIMHKFSTHFQLLQKCQAFRNILTINITLLLLLFCRILSQFFFLYFRILNNTKFLSRLIYFIIHYISVTINYITHRSNTSCHWGRYFSSGIDQKTFIYIKTFFKKKNLSSEIILLAIITKSNNC